MTYVFWTSTGREVMDIFYLLVSFIGLFCVVALAFRKNLAGNGLGITANVGEVITQASYGATGLLLSPIFYMSTHIFGLNYWRKHKDAKGSVVAKVASKKIWLFTLIFIALGLVLFPYINEALDKYRFIEVKDTSFYYINMFAFVIGVSAQATMILRYSFNWILWILVNFVWLAVNLQSGNYIFAAQTMIYQVNAFVGLYEWYQNSKKPEAQSAEDFKKTQRF